jgi:hypothetical protein
VGTASLVAYVKPAAITSRRLCNLSCINACTHSNSQTLQQRAASVVTPAHAVDVGQSKAANGGPIRSVIVGTLAC